MTVSNLQFWGKTPVKDDHCRNGGRNDPTQLQWSISEIYHSSVYFNPFKYELPKKMPVLNCLFLLEPSLWGMRLLLFSDEAHLAPPVVIRLVQLQQLLALQHVHDLHLPFHVSPEEDDHVVAKWLWWFWWLFISRFGIDFDATLGLVTYFWLAEWPEMAK